MADFQPLSFKLCAMTYSGTCVICLLASVEATQNANTDKGGIAMIVNLGRYRLRRYDSRNWVLDEWREPRRCAFTRSDTPKWHSRGLYFQSIGAAMAWLAEHELLDKDAEVDLAGAIREYGAIVDGLRAAFEVETEDE